MTGFTYSPPGLRRAGGAGHDIRTQCLRLEGTFRQPPEMTGRGVPSPEAAATGRTPSTSRPTQSTADQAGAILA